MLLKVVGLCATPAAFLSFGPWGAGSVCLQNPSCHSEATQACSMLQKSALSHLNNEPVLHKEGRLTPVCCAACLRHLGWSAWACAWVRGGCCVACLSTVHHNHSSTAQFITAKLTT